MVAGPWEYLQVLRVEPNITSKEEGKPGSGPIAVLYLLSGCKDCCIQESSIPRPPASAPFWPDPAHRVVVVHFSRRSRHLKKGYTSALLLIPYATLQSVIDHAERSPDPRFPRVVYEWNQWAQRDALLLALDIEDVSADGYRFAPTWAYGSRVCVCLRQTMKLRDHLLMFDLNPWAAKDARRTAPAGSDAPAPPASGPTPAAAHVEERGQEYRDWFCIRRALLPYAVYHGPHVEFGDGHYNNVGFVATHNGFLVLVSGCRDRDSPRSRC